jgi:hypothetical protein
VWGVVGRPAAAALETMPVGPSRPGWKRCGSAEVSKRCLRVEPVGVVAGRRDDPDVHNLADGITRRCYNRCYSV